MAIEASRFVDGRTYVAFDAHRCNDDEPYVYVTEDFGQTWKSLRANLPTGSVRCCCEDIKNADVLYLGTEFSAWVSINRGGSWTKLNNNLPTVAVHEFAQHPTTGEIVAATHGRSLWVLEVTPPRQMTAARQKEKAHLYEPTPAVSWQDEPGHGGWLSESVRRFVGQNPPRGAVLYYSLSQKAKSASLKVLDYTGKTISELPVKTQPGLHQAVWDLMDRPPRPKPSTTPATGPKSQPAPTEKEEEPPEEMPILLGGAAKRVAPGMYRVIPTVDGVELVQGLRVEADPSSTASSVAEGDE